MKPLDELLRFALAPDGEVVADFRRNLPGRGVWVTATAEAVAAAEKRRLFGHAFRETVHVAPGLADRVGDRLAQLALSALSLARKAGALTLGFTKVEAAIAAGQVAALIHASDAAADGVRKLDAAFRRRGGDENRIICLFSEAQLGLALGGAHVIHAALLAGRASENVLDRIAALVRFLGREPPDGTAFHLSTQAADLSAGHSNV